MADHYFKRIEAVALAVFHAPMTDLEQGIWRGEMCYGDMDEALRAAITYTSLTSLYAQANELITAQPNASIEQIAALLAPPQHDTRLLLWNTLREKKLGLMFRVDLDGKWEGAIFNGAQKQVGGAFGNDVNEVLSSLYNLYEYGGRWLEQTSC